MDMSNLTIPRFLLPMGTETVIHACTGHVEVLPGKIPKEKILPVPEDLDKSIMEMGDSSRCIWQVSSVKDRDLGVDKLRDSLADTFWQSDGNLPHTVTMTFHKRTEVSLICFHVFWEQDGSYCPKIVKIRGGDVPGQLLDIIEKEVDKPEGWVKIPVLVDGKPVKGRIFELIITQNHEMGKDSHLRHVNIYGPKPNMFTLGAGVYCESLEFQRWLFPR